MGARISVITPIRAKNPGDVKLLGEAIRSVQAQTFKDWEMVIVNDHSKESLRPLAKLFADERVRGLSAKNRGVCHARNQAVQQSVGDLIIGLDADDLYPEKALEFLIGSYEPGRLIYGGCVVITRDAQIVHKAPDYSFNQLLRTLFMPIGTLHAKADWKRAGGWNPIMERGLEDWEYWIHLGELGVCGKKVNQITYKYRRRPGSRLAHLNSEPNAMTEAYHQMRVLHLDTYNGRRPVQCCGGGGQGQAMPSVQTARARHSGPAAQTLRVPVEAIGDGQLVKVRYTGDMQAEFGLVGDVSGIRYSIPGRGMLVEISEDGRPGVDSRDVPFMMRINRGRDFEVE